MKLCKLQFGPQCCGLADLNLQLGCQFAVHDLRHLAKKHPIQTAAGIYFRLSGSYGLLMPLLEIENSVKT
jgi:hypothetical protein